MHWGHPDWIHEYIGVQSTTNWTKNDSSNLFDVTMGSYDGVEICELVGLFISKHLGKTFGNKNIGLL